MSYCRICGKLLPEQSIFCSQCGTAQTNNISASAQDNTSSNPTQSGGNHKVSPAYEGNRSYDLKEMKQRIKKECPLWPYLLSGLLMWFLPVLVTALLDMAPGVRGGIIIVLTLTVVPVFLIVWAATKRRCMRRMGYGRKQRPAPPVMPRTAPPAAFAPPQPPGYSEPVYTQRKPYQPPKAAAKNKRAPGWVFAVFGAVVLLAAGIAVIAALNGQDNAYSHIAAVNNGAVNDAQSGQTLSGRWEGEYIAHGDSGGGVSLVDVGAPVIIFDGYTAYIGLSSSSYSNDYIMTEGVDDDLTVVCSYEVGDGEITFTQQSGGRSHSYQFDGTTIYYEDYQMHQVK